MSVYAFVSVLVLFLKSVLYVGFPFEIPFVYVCVCVYVCIYIYIYIAMHITSPDTESALRISTLAVRLRLDFHI